MKYRVLFVLYFLSFPSLANDSFADKVCNAYENGKDKEKCFKELREVELKKQSSIQSPVPKLQNNKSIYNAQLDHIFDIMQKSFIGTDSKTLIKYRLDKAMRLYNTPITLDNYNKCASSLVAMRKNSGHREMDILQYMIRMHSSKINFNFPTGAAYAATLMGG